jgi:hypothetical protein
MVEKGWDIVDIGCTISCIDKGIAGTMKTRM